MPIGHARLLEGGSTGADLSAGPWRALYAWRGSARVAAPGGDARVLEAGQGQALGRAACQIAADAPDSRYFVWEVDGPEASGRVAPSGLAQRIAYAMPRLAEDIAPREAVLRFERVDLTLGAITPRHTHRGSGLRVLTEGRLAAEIGERALLLRPGDVWLEQGPDEAVIGRADTTHPTAFVRLLVLPSAAEGQDSFISLEGGAAERPRPAAYARFHEERVVL